MSKVAKMSHIKETTCCIDRTRPTMQSNVDEMLKGMLHVKWRYRKPPEPYHYESPTVLPVES